MNSYGIKVSKDGWDAQVASGDNLLMDTGHKNLKYVKNVYFSESGQYAHELGYAPIAWTWEQDDQGWWRKSTSSLVVIPSTNGGTAIYPSASSNDTYIFSSAGHCEYLVERGFTGVNNGKPIGYGVVVSVEGKSVKNAPGYDRIFDSAYNTYKIYKRGTATLSWDEGVEGWISIDIPHDLGYAPKVIVFGADGMEPSWTSAGYEGQEVFSYYSNTEKLRIVGQRADYYGGILGPLPEYSQTFTYFIFVDRIDDSDFV